MNRRAFLAGALGGTLSSQSANAANLPIIDTHIHLFDTTRPQGVPWPEKTNSVLYKPAMPDRYRALSAPLGIVGAIKVEASPWLEDNQWVLDVAAKDKLIVGIVGNLEAGKPEFAAQLDRFQANPLFRGVRYGNLWGRDMTAQSKRPEFIADLKRLAKANLSLDTANPNPALLGDVVRITDAVPDLRLIIDHLPQMAPAARKEAREHLLRIGKRPQIYVKLSEVFRRREDGSIPTDLSYYRDTLDELFGIFGEDRVLFGSDWPNSDNWKPLPEVVGLVRKYFESKSQSAAEKYFWRNSVKAYRWSKRDASQPG